MFRGGLPNEIQTIMKIERMFRRALVATVAVLMALGCSDGTSTAIPATLVISDGDNQNAPAGTPLAEPLEVRVTGTNQRAFRGATITWSVTSGAGTVSPTTSETNASGVATTTLTPGPTTGNVQVLASISADIAPVTFNATGTAGPASSLVIVSGNGQAGAPGTTAALPLVVGVTDAGGNPVSGAVVTFATANGGSVTPAQSVTDAQGRAQSSFTRGSGAGTQTVTATVAGLPLVTFTFTTQAGAPAALVRVSGNNQSAQAGTTLAAPLVILVTDAFGNPVSGAVATFATSSGGALVPAQATTDAQGNAQTTFTTGAQTGTQTVTATVSGLTAVTFTITSLTGPAAAVEVVSGSGQTVAAGGAVPQPLVARVRDAAGNPVSGTTVVFETTSGGSLGTTQGTTDAQGRVQTTYTSGPQAGNQTVTATVTGLPPASFTITAQAGAAAAVEAVSGGGQSTRAGTALAQPLVVRVIDAVGNLVQGAVVNFATPDGGSLIPTQASTDAQGRAQTAFTTGATPGNQTVTATVSGLPPVIFSATAIDPCTQSTFYTVGASASGTLEASDCSPASGYYVDYFAFSTSAQGALEIWLASTAFSPAVSVLDQSGNVLAAGAGARIKILLAPGSYFAGASSTAPGIGQYGVASQQTTESATGCEVVFATVGIATDQKIAVSDCEGPAGFHYDRFQIALTAGQAITISQNSAVFDAALTLRDDLGAVVAYDDDSGGGTDARITFTAATAGIYSIQAGTFFSAAIGAYTLVIQ